MRFSLLVGATLAALGISGCGAYEAGAPGSFDDGGDAFWSDGDADADADADGDAISDGGDGGGAGGAGGAGTLTAGTWDDNRNYFHYLAYLNGPGHGIHGAPPFDEDEIGNAYGLFSEPGPARTDLEVSLVIDTTGSMSDEMRYLSAEYVAITETIAARFPDASQRWSLVLYRDEGDAYVVRSFDFTTDAGQFRGRLAAQSADGGGDLPEATEQGLAAMNTLSWSDAPNTARIAFWVADAPHHVGNAGAFAEAVRGAQRRGIHIYPVASSGIDGLTELAMRQTAQLTGGRYLFLTDDSGVGGAHSEPTIPCYFVTKLDAALLRMVEVEMTGQYREPAVDEIIRAGGDPNNGACTLAGGEVVHAF